jgi:hypothetical protein
VIRSYDFEAQAYRDVQVPVSNVDRQPPVAALAEGPEAEPDVYDRDTPDSIALSPDGTRLAFFDPVQPAYVGGFMLGVVDLERATTTYVGPIVDYHYSSSGRLVSFPPYLWLDNEHILFARNHSTPDHSIGPVWVSGLDLRSGSLRDIAEVPCRPSMDYVHLVRSSENGPVYLETAGRRYRVDVEANTLVEDNTIGAGFALVSQNRWTELYHDGQLVERVQSQERQTGNWQRIEKVIVSPDGKRACIVVHTQRDYAGPNLHFYDVNQGEVRIVPPGRLQGYWVHWIADEDLEQPSDPPEPPDGWTPF